MYFGLGRSNVSSTSGTIDRTFGWSFIKVVNALRDWADTVTARKSPKLTLFNNWTEEFLELAVE
jgi:hypothetical protein